MSFADSLRQARQASSTVLHAFLLDYKTIGKTIHVFVEGNDDPSFYANYIHGRQDDATVFFYRCSNKKGVYDIHSKIDWTRYESNRAIFLADKDLSDFLGEAWTAADNIYVTEFYSIENYLVDERMMRRVAHDLLHLEMAECERANLFVKFREQLVWFQRFALVAMAWIAYHRGRGARVHLSDVDLSDVISIDEDLKGKVKQKVIKYLDAHTGVTTQHADFVGLRSMYQRVAAVAERKAIVRGKFEVQWFAKFVNAIPNVINSNRQKGEPRIVMNTSLNSGNAVEVLGPRAPIPTTLKGFLERTVDSIEWS